MLDPATRQALKARAHNLKPVVLVGQKGLTEAVLSELNQALADHELLKIRLAGDRDARRAMADEACERCKAELVGLVGAVAILYREAEAAVPTKKRPRAKKRAVKPRSRSAKFVSAPGSNKTRSGRRRQ